MSDFKIIASDITRTVTRKHPVRTIEVTRACRVWDPNEAGYIRVDYGEVVGDGVFRTSLGGRPAPRGRFSFRRPERTARSVARWNSGETCPDFEV
jgi:hypothetical protein